MRNFKEEVTTRLPIFRRLVRARLESFFRNNLNIFKYCFWITYSNSRNMYSIRLYMCRSEINPIRQVYRPKNLCFLNLKFIRKLFQKKSKERKPEPRVLYKNNKPNLVVKNLRKYINFPKVGLESDQFLNYSFRY